MERKLARAKSMESKQPFAPSSVSFAFTTLSSQNLNLKIVQLILPALYRSNREIKLRYGVTSNTARPKAARDERSNFQWNETIIVRPVMYRVLERVRRKLFHYLAESSLQCECCSHSSRCSASEYRQMQ